MKKAVVTLLLVCNVLFAAAIEKNPPKPTAIINIWENMTPPTDNGETGPEVDHKGLYVSHVVTPTLTVYVPKDPKKRTGKAVIACPGGGYNVCWVGTEGHPFAQWFLEQGLTFAVLKYRLPNGHHTVPLEDFQRAITIMREHAGEWGGYNLVGVMGGSAGGHLASTAATHYKDAITRPDFQILCYPVVSFQAHYDGESLHALLGKSDTPGLRAYYSNEMQVTVDTPPAFILHAADDDDVSAVHSTNYAEALMEKGVIVSLHLYPTGGHGCNTSPSWKYDNEYKTDLAKFLKEL